jgi:hypothetical protein
MIYYIYIEFLFTKVNKLTFKKTTNFINYISIIVIDVLDVKNKIEIQYYKYNNHYD